MSRPQESMEPRLIKATQAAIERWGIAETTLERIAAAAGMSRATIYRRGVSRSQLIAAVGSEAVNGFREAMWPALTGGGTAASRMEDALHQLCMIAERHTRMLSDMFSSMSNAFHTEGPEALVIDTFAEPFERLLRDGAADGTLRPSAPELSAKVLFNMVGWSYVHLRASHGWPAETVRQIVVDHALRGLVTN